MGWYPVKKDADVVYVTLVNEVHKVFRCAKATRRSKKTQNLVAPRAIKRVLCNRQQFNMGKPHLLDIRN